MKLHVGTMQLAIQLKHGLPDEGYDHYTWIVATAETITDFGEFFVPVMMPEYHIMREFCKLLLWDTEMCSKETLDLVNENRNLLAARLHPGDS